MSKGDSINQETNKTTKKLEALAWPFQAISFVSIVKKELPWQKKWQSLLGLIIAPKCVTSQNQLPFHEIDKLKKGSAIFNI